MAKRKQFSWHAEQVKAQLLANDPTTCAQWGEYELSGSLADRMEEIVYNHGYEAALMLAAGDTARAKSTKARIEKEFWELAKHEGIVELLEAAWADGLAAGGGMQENPAELLTLCSWCKGVIFDGPAGPHGEVSHGICYSCAVERADEYGLTGEDLEEMREEQGVAKKNPADEAVFGRAGHILRSGDVEFNFGWYGALLVVDVHDDVQHTRAREDPRGVSITAYLDRETYESSEIEADFDVQDLFERAAGEALGMRVSVHKPWHEVQARGDFYGLMTTSLRPVGRFRIAVPK